jgi:pyruvate formate lyase activating enzyme
MSAILVRAPSGERSAGGLVSDTITFSSVDGPGNRFVVFLQGCNFDCLACHNPQTIPGNGVVGSHVPRRVSVDELLEQIRAAAPFLSGVTVSGGEPTQQPAFLRELFTAIKADQSLERLGCFVDSNGACGLEVWESLAPVMERARIDLKCLDPEIHGALTGHPNDPVSASIRYLHDLGLLYEVRMLVLAGLNGDNDLMHRTAHWLAAIDPHMRIKLIGFRDHGARSHHPPLAEPSPATMESIADKFLDVAQFDVHVV